MLLTGKVSSTSTDEAPCSHISTGATICTGIVSAPKSSFARLTYTTKEYESFKSTMAINLQRDPTTCMSHNLVQAYVHSQSGSNCAFSMSWRAEFVHYHYDERLHQGTYQYNQLGRNMWSSQFPYPYSCHHSYTDCSHIQAVFHRAGLQQQAKPMNIKKNSTTSK